MALFNRINKAELREQAAEEAVKRTTLSFYRYHQIKAPNEFRNLLYRELSKLQVFGRIYVASEGINGQISIPSEKLDELRSCFDRQDGLQDMRLNLAIDAGLSFFMLKIKVKDKIVADGLPPDSVDLSKTAPHIDAKTFNEMIARKSTVVIDMRNHYESEVGHFEGAICPDVETFRESLPVVEKILEEHSDKKVIMYCTGGIRCEKASAYFNERGFDNLYQLDGGIIQYTRQTEAAQLPNNFRGKNFVFDERLGERISNEVIARCHQCGAPADQHINCANDACHLLFIQCEDCAKEYQRCCSSKCRDFNELPEDRQKALRGTTTFNGSKFGKGRYKAHRADHDLSLD